MQKIRKIATTLIIPNRNVTSSFSFSIAPMYFAWLSSHVRTTGSDCTYGLSASTFRTVILILSRTRISAYASDAHALMNVRERIKLAVRRVLDTHPDVNADPVVRTWEESQAKWMGAIEKEMVLVTGLFGMISIVAVFLIFCIFYMIVVEKTRDIGIIKSVGATSSGVAGIFLGYGAVIGIVGAALGLLFGYLVVHYINTLHSWLGTALHVQVWDPEVYAFDTIPNTLEPQRIFWILAIAVVASILGALVPALRAARLNPVEALRWE